VEVDRGKKLTKGGKKGGKKRERERERERERDCDEIEKIEKISDTTCPMSL
jgi:hypothetical protein